MGAAAGINVSRMVAVEMLYALGLRPGIKAVYRGKEPSMLPKFGDCFARSNELS